MTQMLPNLCPRCKLPVPPGGGSQRCPRYGADLTVEQGPITWLSSVGVALCAFLAGASATQLLAVWLLPQAWFSLWVRSAVVLVGFSVAALAAWLSRHLAPATRASFFRACVALLGGFLLARTWGMAVRITEESPDVVLAFQAGATAAVYLLLRLVGW